MAQKNVNQLKLCSKFSELEKIKPFIADIFSDTTELPLNKIQLAVNEAATNALIHGNKQDQAKKITITVRHNKKTIEVSVKDEGEGFDPAELPNPTQKEQLLNKGGRGVFLIKKYADEISFEAHGTLVRMVFYR